MKLCAVQYWGMTLRFSQISEEVPGEIPMLKGRGCSSYLSGIRKAVLISLREFSLKSSTAGAFEALFRQY